ncbi:hypothetical protein SEVIR_3G334400v4 [Setaria viridis]|uniref:SAM domain-containing protein n=2 Tax=Setaria TaxID=4554 RepID=A0A368QLI1_SETIT|nr:protein Smaug homolog 2-like [Setaria italica]XP_034586281.1 protein Smaug homolog 2-like [Setaria viridis]RCV18672.1 hypothetical protein SETIT_3G321100v2 [Setaria italica]RCV18673.1 hypothetical protein SETIT_3G321100v2 [Setaria italica]RCV18674.1 hypothetical protein SETIT_3G321100v2 [Setaria italica]RCV18675.1 hypothetical protein SETIT_3G321100v2 [Setaria italica]TKW28541.1 hypothetical protein SEVIR_3G334400v2 [Setaria viridis]
MDDHAGGPHDHRPSPPPSSDAGKRRRVPNVRLAGSVPPPSHLPHPRRVPIVPATRSRIPLHLQQPHQHTNHHQIPSADPPQTLPKPPADSGDDLVLAAAFPRKPRVPAGPAAAGKANGRAEGTDTETETEEYEEAGEEVADVAGWLWGMGMGRYAAAFQAHEVDAAVLPCLTMDDLRDMGIGAVGARRKLFCAIQRLTPPPPARR